PLAGAGGGGRVRAALESILGELAEPDVAGRGGADPVAASAACHGSVRAGAALAASEMAALLRDLEACLNPHTCPHGRPTFVGFPAAELERQFGRR
ncbi:MAG: DNA mismatch repair protein MutL, partial [Chloroflexota bacterium]|nr:DNA mismatch repair protein MutL [Chloroflexota bacterium]